MSKVLMPTSLELLVQLLHDNPTARVLAGGTDLFVRLRADQSSHTPDLVSLARVPELQNIAEESGFLSIGAATPLQRILAHELVRTHAPLMLQALGTIGGPAIRNMGTLGGNICTASPAGDSLPPLYLLDTRLELASLSGTRVVSIADFIHGPGKTVLSPGEVLTRILVPKTEPCAKEHFVKVGRRAALSIAVVSFAGQGQLDEHGCIAALNMAWGSVGPTVMRLPSLETALIGTRVDHDMLGHVQAAVRSGLHPMSDLRASAQYRLRVAANLTCSFVEALGEKSRP